MPWKGSGGTVEKRRKKSPTVGNGPEGSLPIAGPVDLITPPSQPKIILDWPTRWEASSLQQFLSTKLVFPYHKAPTAEENQHGHWKHSCAELWGGS